MCAFVGAQEAVYADLSTTCLSLAPFFEKVSASLAEARAQHCSESNEVGEPADLDEASSRVHEVGCTKEDIAAALAPARTEMKQCVAEAGFDVSAISACMCAFVGAQEAVYADLSTTCPSLAPYFEKVSASLAEARAQHCSESNEVTEPVNLDEDESVIGDVFDEAAELMETGANQTADSSPFSTYAKNVFDIIQRVRAAGYRCPDGRSYAPNSRKQVFDCRLREAARLHSSDMANNNYFSHDSRDGRGPTQRARDTGFPGQVGEIIAGGQTAAEGAVQSWQRSTSGHCNLMMNPK